MVNPNTTAGRAFRMASGHHFANSTRSILRDVLLRTPLRQEYRDAADLERDLQRRGFTLRLTAPGKLTVTHKYGGFEVFTADKGWRGLSDVIMGIRELRDDARHTDYNDDDVPF